MSDDIEDKDFYDDEEENDYFEVEEELNFDKERSFDDEEDSVYEEEEGDDEEEEIKTSENACIYVDPNLLLSDIKDYYKTGVFSKRLADSIFMMAKKMATRGNFCGYSWRDEMILDGYEKMAMAIFRKKFDITKNYSPFSYLSRICWRCFVLRIKTENRHKDEEKKYREMFYDKIKSDNTGVDVINSGEPDSYEKGEDQWEN